MDLAHIVYWERNVLTEMMTLNDAFYTLYGTSAEREGGYHITTDEFIRRFVPPDDTLRVRQLAELTKAKDGGDYPDYVEHRIVRGDGEMRHMIFRMKLVKDSTGEILKVFGATQDVTELKEMEKALATERDFVSAVLANAGALVIVLDPEARIVRFNRACEQVTGYSFDDVKGKFVWDVLMLPEEVEILKAVYERQVESRQFSNEIESCWMTKDHARRLIRWATTGVLGQDGSVEFVVGSGIDITEQRQAEEALQQAHDELEQRVRERTETLRRQAELLELAHNAILVCDLEDRIVFWNARAEELYGWTKAEALGKAANTLLDADTSVPFGEYLAVMKEGRRQEELRHRTKDGRQILVLSRQSLQRDEQGNPLAVLSINLDITEIRKTEQRLRQVHKMEALGRLSGGIAHDFNNILAAMIGFTELVAAHAVKGSQDERFLSRVMSAGIRGRELVRQMLTFSRQTEQEKKLLSLGGVIKETVHLMRASTPATVRIRTEGLDVPGLVLGDAIQIQQIIMNLCTNAVHAMQEKGGNLGIELSECRIETDHGSSSQDMNPGPYMKLVVRDTGEGISADIVDKIFDPFFTTKKPGKGTGLGLSVVHGIVKGHDGYVTVESHPNEGSTFTVYFPKTGGKLAESGVSHEEAPTGCERILFVDDEEALVEMAENMLAELGYGVTSQLNSREALALLRLDISRFDLVITDQTMPDMTGIELAKEILALRVDMPIIMCTGFSHLVDATTAKAAGIRGFVMKPLTKREIAVAIREVLDGEGSTVGLSLDDH
jgi:PAS domain S-box-containing protein